MGRKHLLKNYPLWVDVDSSTDPVSERTEVSNLDFISYDVLIDPTVKGDLIVQYSMNGDQWNDLDFSTPNYVDGSLGNHYRLEIKSLFNFLRLKFENDSGAGLINAVIHGKTVGA